MKRSFKKTAVEQEVAKQHSNENGIGNIEVTKVANFLLALIQPESEASQMLKIAKMDVATWLNRSTDGVVTCVITDGKLTIVNESSEVSSVIPLQALDVNLLASALSFLLELGKVKQESKTVESTVERPTSTPDSIKIDINNLFAKEKDEIFSKVASAATPRQKRQVLFGQLIRICAQCGFTTTRSKKVLVSLLDEDNREEYQSIYDMVA